MSKQYLDKGGLSHFWEKIKSFFVKGDARVFVGNCSTGAASTEKAVVSPNFTSSDLVKGTIISVYFDNTNSGAVASLTLNVNGTGAKAIKYIYNGSISNIPGANYIKAGQMYQFYYDGTYWVVQMIYNTNSDTKFILYYSNPVAGSGGLQPYGLAMMLPDGTYATFTTTGGIGTSKTKNAVGFVPGKVWYHWKSTVTAEGSCAGNNCWSESNYLIDLRYSGNQGTTLTARKPVYLVGTIGSDGLFYLADTWFTQTKPTSEDGKVYFYLGLAYDTHQIDLDAYNPMYRYVNGAFRQCVPNSDTVNGHTVNSDVPANAKFTDTTYTAATTAPGKVASTSSQGSSTNYARQDHTHGIDLATGDANGQVKIAGTNVSVKGLGTMAYKSSLVKSDVGLGNVDNTADADKPVSTAQESAFKSRGIEYIKGTQTAATGSWTGVSTQAALYDGMQIAYWLPFAGSGNATLNLTLSDGTTTGAVNCYYNGVTRLTTHFAAGNIVHLIYRENVTIGTGTYTGWWSHAQYWQNTTPAFLYHYNSILAKTAITAESLIVGDSSGYSRVASGVTFDISYPIVWCTAALAAGANNYANMFLCHYDRNIATGAKSGFTSTKNKVIYLVVTISGNTATIDSTIITDTLPSSADGKVYIVLGKLGNWSTGANYFLLYPSHPMFWYKDGAIRPYGTIDKAITSIDFDGSYNASTRTINIECSQTTEDITVTLPEATQSNAGLMSAADKKKLDGLPGAGSSPFTGKKMLLMGNSYMRGTGGTIGHGWGYHFTQFTGCDSTIIQQAGGDFVATGNTNSDYPGKTHLQALQTFANTLTAAQRAEYDYVVVGGGYNDHNQNSDTLAAAIDTFVSTCRTLFPNAKIWIIPLWCDAPMTSALEYTNFSLWSSRAAQNGCGSCSMTFSWLYGRSDYGAGDSIHLNDDGYQLCAKFIHSVMLGWDGNYIPTVGANWTLGTNVSVNTSGFRYYRDGKNVFITGALDYTNSVATTKLGTIGDPAYLPQKAIYFPVFLFTSSTSTRSVAMACIQADGVLRLIPLAASIPASGTVYINHSFMYGMSL